MGATAVRRCARVLPARARARRARLPASTSDWARRCSTPVRKPPRSSSSSVPPRCSLGTWASGRTSPRRSTGPASSTQAVTNLRAALAANDNALHRAALATVIPGEPFRDARRRARGAPRFRRERSALAALPLLPGAQPGPPPRRLPLVVLRVGQLDEAGLGPRQRARPHRLRSPPPLGRDGGRMRGRRIPAGSSRHVRVHPGARQRSRPPSASPPPSSISSSTSTATARSAACPSSPTAPPAPSWRGSTTSPRRG